MTTTTDDNVAPASVAASWAAYETANRRARGDYNARCARLEEQEAAAARRSSRKSRPEVETFSGRSA